MNFDCVGVFHLSKATVFRTWVVLSPSFSSAPLVVDCVFMLDFVSRVSP